MGRTDWLVVAISGATCSGKSTLTKKLNEVFRDAVVLHQDDFFFDVGSDRHTIIPELNHINFEILTSLDNDAFLEKINFILNGHVTTRRTGHEFDAALSQYIPDIAREKKNIPHILILDGFLLLNEPRIAALCDIKLFITLDEPTCWARRSARTYEPPDPPGYFQLHVWPAYLHYSQQVRDTLEDVVYFTGTDAPDQLLHRALQVIMPRLYGNLEH